MISCWIKTNKNVVSEDEIVVSTTRPETMLGDVAVAVHPDDVRYSRFHNVTLWHPFRHLQIPLIRDSMVDMSLGTGAIALFINC